MSEPNRLNSLTDSILGEFGLLQTDPLLPGETTPKITPLDTKIKPQHHKALRLLLSTAIRKLSKPKQELFKSEIWRCVHIFPDGRICNTPNGLYSNQNIVRKTCSKCARPRTIKLTIAQEIEREYLIEEIMDFDDISYTEAMIKLDEANNNG